MDGGSDTTMTGTQVSTCVACNGSHPVGHCPLKLAGVEHCGLCGIAHIGYSRTCPHLNSEAQVAMMLGSLKQSTEQRALVDVATKYLRGIRGDLVRRKKIQAQKDASSARPAGAPPVTPSITEIPSRDRPQSLPRSKYRSPYPSPIKPLQQNPFENPYGGLASSAGHSYQSQSGKKH